MITGDFVNGLHLMVGLSTDTKPDTTSENTFFLEEDTGAVYYFSEGEWSEAGAAVAGIVAALLNTGALPAVTATDNGKVLKVMDGAWAPVTGGGGDVTVDEDLDADSENPVQNKAIYAALALAAEMLSEREEKPIAETVADAAASITAENNYAYSCGTLTSLTISDSGQNISFTVDFTSGSTATVLTVPSGYKAPGGDLTPEASKAYELNVRNGKAVLTAFEAVSTS